MRKILVGLILLGGFIFSLQGQTNIEGIWIVEDEEKGKPASYIELYKEGNQLKGRIIHIVDDNPDALVCLSCEGDKKDKPLIGMDVVWDLSENGNEWNGGQLLNPLNGKQYNCKMELADNHTLKVRGYKGISLFGKTIEWKKLSSNSDTYQTITTANQ